MNGLFSLKSILNENAAFKSMIQTPTNEVYLNSALPILETFNRGINESTLSLYQSIAEATSRAEENDKFAKYFKDYKSLVNNYIREMNELISKAAINIGTYIDANKSTIDNADGMSVVGEPSIKVYDFKNLDNDNVPHIDIEKAFKKEFKFIGKMMQDLGSAITNDEAKANVLATVCNNLQSEIQDDWVEKCMCKIADYDENTDCKKTNFASMMYKKFIPEDLHDMNITDGDIQQARLALMNASTLVAGLERANDEFASGLENIANEIGAMFFRNQDNNMPVKTDAEGIADRNYKLSASGFNQFNIFMSNKCTQITELCNLYLIAISIKADMIYKYLKQCVDIIETAQAGVDNTPNDGDINSSEDDISDDSTGDDLELDDDIEAPNMDDNSSILGNDSSNDESSDSNIDDEVSPEEANAAESDVEECAYLFEANLFEINRLYDNYAVTTYFNEADGDGIFSRIKELLAKLLDAIKRFFNFKGKKIDAAVTHLKDNDYVTALKAAPIPEGMTIDWIDTSKVEAISVSDSKQFKDTDLDDLTQYIRKTWNSVIGSNATCNKLTDDIIESTCKKGTKYTDNERNNSIDFLLNFDKLANDINNESTKLNNTSKNDLQLAQDGKITLEGAISSLEETMVAYFNEADENNNNNSTSSENNNSEKKPSDNNQQQSNQNKSEENKSNSGNTESYGKSTFDNQKAFNRVKNYYIANTRMISAKLNVLRIAAVKYIDFLNHILSYADYEKNKENKSSNEEKKTENNNTDNNGSNNNNESKK